MIVASPAMRAVVRDAWRVAQSDATVLLTGESGTGKEVLADLIHRCSRRSGGPLVAVNCGAIPKDLVASELFGHRKGAFTGAGSPRLGRFREAHGGTLLLDEIGELPLDLQPTLLRVLETGRLTPVGADHEVEVDYRLVASTNKDLEAAIDHGRFRSDLYYRLNVIALELPPLRQRGEEILPLARHLLARTGHGDRRISASAARQLLAHTWPGNVRELANAMERAALLSRTEIILPEHLPPAVRAAVPEPERAELGHLLPTAQCIETTGSEEGQTLLEREIAYIRQVLHQTGGNRTQAAKLLGITRRGLIYKIKRFGL
jgi:DNA-binding NtrC family response regulator